MTTLLERAGIALGRLDGIGRLLPGPESLLYSYIKKEAVLSSQIEGTQSSLTDLLLHESDSAPGAPLDDVREVSNYISALQHGLERLPTLPLSLRLLREVHEKLVADTRGGEKSPGEFRSSQNWIGGTRPGNAFFVPPPPREVLPALGALEKFLHSRELPALVRSGLAHAQFETIHPFLDGNGRVGRMLITLALVDEGVLSKPWLYMSLYFKRNRTAYYDYLQRVRTHGDWESWLEFFLEGVAEVAEDASQKLASLQALFNADRERVQRGRGDSIYSRAAVLNNLNVFEHLRTKLVTTISEVTQACGLSKPTAARVLAEFEELGLAREITGARRNRVYLYDGYFQLLNED